VARFLRAPRISAIEETSMHKQEVRAAARRVRGRRIAIVSLLSAMGLPCAFAQTAPLPAASDAAPSEAARRAALSPYRFILLNATPAKPKPAAAPGEARKTSPAAERQAAVRPAPIPSPKSPGSPATAASAVSQAVAVAAPAIPEPEPIKAVRMAIVPIQTDPPHLPAALMRLQPSGTVRVRFEVNPDGSTGVVKVVSSTNRDLNRASVDAVQGWRFEPIDEAQSVETELVYNYQ
jgi:TonB family protein